MRSRGADHAATRGAESAGESGYGARSLHLAAVPARWRPIGAISPLSSSGPSTPSASPVTRLHEHPPCSSRRVSRSRPLIVASGRTVASSAVSQVLMSCHGSPGPMVTQSASLLALRMGHLPWPGQRWQSVSVPSCAGQLRRHAAEGSDAASARSGVVGQISGGRELETRGGGGYLRHFTRTRFQFYRGPARVRGHFDER